MVASPDILYRVYSLVYTWSLGVIGEKTILCSDGRQAGLNFIDTLDPRLDVGGKIPLGSQTLFIKEEVILAHQSDTDTCQGELMLWF